MNAPLRVPFTPLRAPLNDREQEAIEQIAQEFIDMENWKDVLAELGERGEQDVHAILYKLSMGAHHEARDLAFKMLNEAARNYSWRTWCAMGFSNGY